jgi:hypothetical protein
VHFKLGRPSRWIRETSVSSMKTRRPSFVTRMLPTEICFRSVQTEVPPSNGDTSSRLCNLLLVRLLFVMVYLAPSEYGPILTLDMCHDKWHCDGTNDKVMAHKAMAKQRTEEFLTIPLRFGARIELVADAVNVAGWIVGYPPLPVPNDEDRWLDHTSFSIAADASEDFLSRAISHARSHPLNGEMARRFILRNGTLREWDWHRVDEVLRSSAPKEVKDELARVNPRPDSMVYLLSVKQFYQEWELIRFLALMAGKLAEKTSPIHVNSEAKAAQEILRDLMAHHAPPRLQGKAAAGPELESSLGVPTAKKSKQVLVKVGGQQSLPDSLRFAITRLYGRAFHRGVGEGSFGVAWGAFSAGPRVGLNVGSVLGIAYLGLLANFSRGWKCCGREDCGNIFRVTDDKRKKFCSQYCGHLVSLRNTRKKARRKESRSRSRNKEGKR